MHLHLTRDTFTDGATLGTLTIDGKPFGYVCEDRDRGLDATMPLAEIRARKVRGQTAIPAGTYRLGVRYSPGHKRDVLYLIDVPGFQFILVHSGNDASHTEGCQLPGTQRDVAAMTVGHSKAAVAWLEANVMPLVRQGAAVTYEITRDPAAWAQRG